MSRRAGVAIIPRYVGALNTLAYHSCFDFADCNWSLIGNGYCTSSEWGVH